MSIIRSGWPNTQNRAKASPAWRSKTSRRVISHSSSRYCLMLCRSPRNAPALAAGLKSRSTSDCLAPKDVPGRVVRLTLVERHDLGKSGPAIPFMNDVLGYRPVVECVEHVEVV